MYEQYSHHLVGDYSWEEDSGHDSVDDVGSERERITSLEVALSWIRDEVVRV